MKTVQALNIRHLPLTLALSVMSSLGAAEVGEKPAATAPSDAQLNDIINGDSITGQDRRFEILTQYSLGFSSRVNTGRDSDLPLFNSFDTKKSGWGDFLQVRGKYILYDDKKDRVTLTGDIKRNNIFGNTANSWADSQVIAAGGQPNSWDITGTIGELHHFDDFDGLASGGAERVFSVDLSGISTRYFAEIGASRLTDSHAHLNKLTTGIDWYNYDKSYARSGTKYNARYTHAWLYDETNYFRRLQGELEIGQYHAHSAALSYQYILPRLTYFYRTGAQIQTNGTWDFTASASYERRDYNLRNPKGAAFGTQIAVNSIYAVSAQRWFSTYTFAKLTGRINTRSNYFTAYDDLTGITLLVGTTW